MTNRRRDPDHEARRRALDEFSPSPLVRNFLDKFGSITFCISLALFAVLFHMVSRMAYSALLAARQCFLSVDTVLPTSHND
jgi:hypothetical protein